MELNVIVDIKNLTKVCKNLTKVCSLHAETLEWLVDRLDKLDQKEKNKNEGKK